jgi:adenylate cyclase
MARLSYRDDEGEIQEHELGDRVTLGRHPAQDIQVLERVVSKEHALIERSEDGYHLRDRESRNGTYLNGSRIHEPVQLQSGDRIEIGSTTLFFEGDEARQEDFQQRSGTVTIHNEALQTHIRQRLPQEESEERFLPADQIGNDDVLKRDYEKLRIAHELSSSIGPESELQQLLEQIVDKAFDLFSADRAAILLQNEESGELVPKVVESRREDEESEDIHISQTILDEVADKKTAVSSSNAMQDARFSGSKSIMIGQIRSAMCVPMLHDNELLGVIYLDTKMDQAAFSDKDLQILSGFARQAAVLVSHHRLLKKREEEIVVREKVRRLLPPELVEEVVTGRLELEKGGEMRRATVMFADIRNFTSYSEQVPAQKVVTNLNEYFELMVDLVFEYEGTLDKFIGDEIMAIWGAPIEKEDDAERAVQCAIEIQEAIEAFNEERAEEGRVTFEIGVGLNTGDVIAGYMGSTRRMNYTVMGDVVNTANRICSKADPGEIYIGPKTFQKVGHAVDFELMPSVNMKGKSKNVDIYRIDGLDESVDTQEEETMPRRSFQDTERE